jgi:hypothetical protein
MTRSPAPSAAAADVRSVPYLQIRRESVGVQTGEGTHVQRL